MGCYVVNTAKASQSEYDQWKSKGYPGTWDDYCAMKKRSEGGTAIICGKLGPHCADCAGLGEFLCDYPVGKGKTCDRNMCDGHAHEIGPDIHYCDTHYRMWQKFRDGGGVNAALENVIAFKQEKKLNRPTARTTKNTAPAESAADIIAKHNRVLLHALQTGHPVMYQGKQQFMHTVTYQRFAGGISTTAYIAGNPNGIPPDQITLYEVPQ